MSIVEQACNEILPGDAQLRHVEREAVKISLDNLLTFPWVKRRVEDERLKLHGWWFDPEVGELLVHEAEDNWTSLTR